MPPGNEDVAFTNPPLYETFPAMLFNMGEPDFDITLLSTSLTLQPTAHS